MALDDKREGDENVATRIINIYNQKQLSEHPSPTYTSDCISNLQWDLNAPTVITGDWNIHHPQWDNSVTSACLSQFMTPDQVTDHVTGQVTFHRPFQGLFMFVYVCLLMFGHLTFSGNCI